MMSWSQDGSKGASAGVVAESIRDQLPVDAQTILIGCVNEFTRVDSSMGWMEGIPEMSIPVTGIGCTGKKKSRFLPQIVNPIYIRF